MSADVDNATKMQEAMSAHLAALRSKVGEEVDHQKKAKDELNTLTWSLPDKPAKGQKMFSEVFGIKPKAPFKDFPVPVFEEKEWDSEVRPFIPDPDEGFVLDTTLTPGLVLAWMNGDNTFLWGPKGSGKSSYPKELCARMRIPFIRLGMKEDMESSELLGSNTIRGKEVVWVDGPVTIAATYGATLVLDESSNITPGAAIALHPILEEKRLLLLADKMGTIAERMVKIDARFRVFLTDNTNLQGDITGKYVGTKVQNEAFIDRIFSKAFVGYMAPEEEKKLVMGRVPELPESIAVAMVKFADLVRKNYGLGQMQMTVSPRVLINWARKACQWGDIAAAYRWAFGAGLADDDQKIAAEHFRKVFGG